MKNKYYICESCGNLTTEDHILEDCACGGVGMCHCRFMHFFWDEEFNCPNNQTDRIYLPFTQIKKEHYEWLLTEDNTVTRLRMLQTIPKKLLLKNDDI